MVAGSTTHIHPVSDTNHFLTRTAVRRWLDERKDMPVRRVLLPLDDWCLCQPAFASALDLALQTKAELVLLRVRGRDDALSGPDEDQEQVFVALKGLHAQMQQHTVSYSIDTLAGQTADSLVDYSAAHNIDLIVMADDMVIDPVDNPELSCGRATCPTLMIRGN
jgi:hypothetical protein